VLEKIIARIPVGRLGHAEEIARGIPKARLEVIPAAGHQAPLEQDTVFNQLLGGFAEGLT